VGLRGIAECDEVLAVIKALEEPIRSSAFGDEILLVQLAFLVVE
jgi:hypothetical protein